MFAFPAGRSRLSSNPKLPPAMPVWASPISFRLASDHPAFKIQNLILPPGRQRARLRLFALAQEAAFYVCGSFADGTRDLIHQGLGYKKTGSLQLCKHWPASRYQAASFRQGHQIQCSVTCELLREFLRGGLDGRYLKAPRAQQESFAGQCREFCRL